MFSRSGKGRVSSTGCTFSIIRADVVIDGDIRAQADLHIDGAFHGDAHCAALVQGAGSRIEGRVVANSARG